MSNVHLEAIRLISSSLRTTADQLDQLLAANSAGAAPALVPPATPPSEGAASGVRVFDPETDTPPVQPKVVGTREEQDWCCLIFFARLLAINVRQGRGATAADQTAIVRAAGYQDRRAYAGWSWTWRDDESGRRWITDDHELSEADRLHGRSSGMAFLRWYAKSLNVKLSEDLQGYLDQADA